MTWADEPATEMQLGHLGQFGHRPGLALTKREASRLITWFEEHKAPSPALESQAGREREQPEAYLLRIAVECAKRTAAQPRGDQAETSPPGLAAAMARREDFWLDTCREVTQMRFPSAQVLEFYKQFGCRFFAPNRERVQEILSALDSVMPTWDIDHPELFYQTLELNFPDSVHQR